LTRWTDLQPEPDICSAVSYAGVRPTSGQDAKRRWSEKFANGCAVAVAKKIFQLDLGSKKIRPESIESGTEPLTPLGSGTSKRIDVTVVDSILGLEVGVSLKGLNFRDGTHKNFDKNLTGRLYELGDEVRLVHEYLPRAFMVGIFFLPLASTVDKTQAANSSFANTVLKLRERTGRLDPAIGSQASKCDAGFVALYTTGDPDTDGNDSTFTCGVTRFFPVDRAPPRRGRPKVHDTFSLVEVVQEIISAANHSSHEAWSDPEE
jgi:hypothetical protein